MSEKIIIKLPLVVLAELVASAESQADAVEQLENLAHEWAVVERVPKQVTSPLDLPNTDPPILRSQWFETRDELVEHLEHMHVNQSVETVAVLRSGSPRNMKVNVKVQFR